MRSGMAVVLLALAGGAAGWYLLADREQVRPEEPKTASPAIAAEAGPTPAAAAIPTAVEQPAKPAAAAASGKVLFPDGSSLPALNGVQTEITPRWGPTQFSKVVGIEDGPGGWQWYVHENGARSTTAMVTMNGIPQAMGVVAEPGQPLPLLPDLGDSNARR